MNDLLRAFAADLRRERTVILVLVYAALALLLHEYALLPHLFGRWFPGTHAALAPFAWWVGGMLVAWVVLPLLLGRRLGFGAVALGLGTGDLARQWRVYALLGLLAVPATLLAATRPAFAGAYPLLRTADGTYGWGLLAGYWGLYGLQFAAVEFFFRGFLPFMLAPRFGVGAVAVSAVPYALIHLHKPWPEAVGAVAGGVVLAWLALRVRSIWGGVALHVAVALAMDAAALTVAGAWP